MKKTIAIVICLVFALVSVLTFAACTDDSGASKETTADTTADTPAATTPETQPETQPETPAETVPETTEETKAPETTDPETQPEGETTADTTEGGGDGEEIYDPELYVLIRTPEDLMQFNANVNGEDSDIDYSFMTVLFMNDIDMSGYEWTPLDGYWLEDVTFDGQGHTISNLKFIDHVSNGLPLNEQGSGFIGVNYYTNTFKNITFKNASVTASASHVGCIIGTNRIETNDTVYFENVHVDNFAGNGWLNTEDPALTIRVGGFIGSNNAGFAEFTDCSATNLTLSGFHNLCGFIGYDHTSNIDEISFSNCRVENCKFTFSYCLSASYTVDMPRKFVSVFYCASNWADNIDYVVEHGNSFSEVYYYDWTNDNAEYRAEEFRSWTREEAEADAQG